MIGLLMDRTVQVARLVTVGRDRLGNPEKGWADGPRLPCRLEQGATAEDSTDAFEVAVWRGYFPAGTVLHNGDRLHADGLVFTVEGSPSAQGIPGVPIVDHVLAALRLVREVE